MTIVVIFPRNNPGVVFISFPKVTQIMGGHGSLLLQATTLEVGPGTSVVLHSLDDSDDMSRVLGGYPIYDDIFIAKWIKKYGTTYSKGKKE